VIADPAIRQRLPLLSRVLIGYGAIGLGVAALAIVVLLIGLGRVNALGDRLRDDVGGVSAVLETTADVLEGASGSADGIDRTISSSSTALSTAAADLRGIEPLLRDIETRANAINILGSQPLAPLAGQFGAIAGQLGDLDGQLDSIAANLQGNQAALSANAASLTTLARRTRDLATRLGGDELPSVLDDARWLLVAMLLIGSLGAAVPAAGALLLGLWLRRELP
jgi:hypothetical protein